MLRSSSLRWNRHIYYRFRASIAGNRSTSSTVNLPFSLCQRLTQTHTHTLRQSSLPIPFDPSRRSSDLVDTHLLRKSTPLLKLVIEISARAQRTRRVRGAIVDVELLLLAPRRADADDALVVAAVAAAAGALLVAVAVLHFDGDVGVLREDAETEDTYGVPGVPFELVFRVGGAVVVVVAVAAVAVVCEDAS
jgi:hypothetical protein